MYNYTITHAIFEPTTTTTMYNYTITHAIFEPTTTTTIYNYTITHAIFADVVELMVGRASNRSPVEE
jgi:hypothetical protein